LAGFPIEPVSNYNASMKSNLPLRDVLWMVLTVPLGVVSAGLLLVAILIAWLWWQSIGLEFH
jgi:hypothetical protein